MADAPKAPPTKRVAVLDPDGHFGTVDASDVQHLPDGARVLSQKEVAARQLEQEYENKSATEKVGQFLAGRGIGPQSEAFLSAARRSFTAGANEAIVKTAADAVAPGAGKQYAERLDTLQTAAPEATTAGTVTGIAAGVATSLAGGGGAGAGAARLLPQNAISALGAPVEAAFARALPAATSTLGKAAAAAVGVGARGAVEGGVYAATEELNRQIVHDPELSADKIFSGGIMGGAFGLGIGAAAGAGGSLIGSAIEKAVSKAVTRSAEGISAGSASGKIAEMAQEQAWKSVGGGFGLQSTRYAKLADRAGGTKGLGEISLRHGIIDTGDEAAGALRSGLNAAKTGTPAEQLGRIETARATVGQRIGEITEASGASVDGAELGARLRKIKEPYERIAGREGEVAVIDDYVAKLDSKLARNADGTVPIQSLLEQRRGLDDIIYEEAKTLDPKGRLKVLREARGEIEDVIMDSLDGASGKAPGELRKELVGLKKDYAGLSLLRDVAEDSAARAAKKATFGVTDVASAASAVAAGHPLAAPVMAIGSKLLKERGNAFAAAALHKLSQAEGLASLIGRADQKLNAAAHGLLTSPARAALPVGPIASPRKQADAAMKQIAALQADPAGTAEKMAKAVEPIAESHPDIANVLVARQAAALSFLASKMPQAEEPDPLSPHPQARMSDAEAYSFAKYVSYAEKPERFFDEVAHGKVTYEGAEAAAALMPRAFAELQARTMESIAAHMARGRTIPFQQRQKLGDMLGVAAVPSQRPEHEQFLQSLVQSNSPQQPSPRAAKSGASPAKHQRSALDMLEANGPGRR